MSRGHTTIVRRLDPSLKEGFRRHLVKKLPDALRAHGFSPSKQLMKTLERIALEGDDNLHVLTKTWQACADVIRAHIERSYTETDRYPRQRFLRPARVFVTPDGRRFLH